MDSTEPAAIGSITGYHAHVYYDTPEARLAADRLRARVAERFRVQMGRWRDEPVGPHPRAMFQIAFTPDVFPVLLPWLMLNRDDLTIMVHPNTDSPLDDHLRHPLWLGGTLALDGSMLPVSLRASGITPDPIVPNTTPEIAG